MMHTCEQPGISNHAKTVVAVTHFNCIDNSMPLLRFPPCSRNADHLAAHFLRLSEVPANIQKGVE